MTDAGSPYRLEPKPLEPVAFDYGMYEWMLAEGQRLDALYGPRIIRISGGAPLIHWYMRQFPQADPGVTVTLLGSIALSVDNDVPIDSLRLTYADGTHKDVRVIGAGDD